MTGLATAPTFASHSSPVQETSLVFRTFVTARAAIPSRNVTPVAFDLLPISAFGAVVVNVSVARWILKAVGMEWKYWCQFLPRDYVDHGFHTRRTVQKSLANDESVRYRYGISQ